MNIIKSDRITILPIINKNKQNSLNQYMNQIFLAKNHISQLLSQDINFQYFIFICFLLFYLVIFLVDYIYKSLNLY